VPGLALITSGGPAEGANVVGRLVPACGQLWVNVAAEMREIAENAGCKPSTIHRPSRAPAGVPVEPVTCCATRGDRGALGGVLWLEWAARSLGPAPPVG